MNPLQGWRTRCRVSRAKLAIRLGVSVATVRRREAAAHASNDDLMRWAKALGARGIVWGREGPEGLVG